jgi:hypothetical protein
MAVGVLVVNRDPEACFRATHLAAGLRKAINMPVALYSEADSKVELVNGLFVSHLPQNQPFAAPW